MKRALALLLALAASATAAAPPKAPAADCYAVLCSPTAWQAPEWRAVAESLAERHRASARFEQVCCHPLPESPEAATAETIASALRQTGARYAAFVMLPSEIGRQSVSTLHRATRMRDGDPWGDCLWGIVTGAEAQDALRIANHAAPLIINRLLATTNINPAPFEHSCCITDWEGSPVLEQSGHTEPTRQELAEGTGREGLFAAQLSSQRPQLLVTASHATPFNLEMPFGKGLLFSSAGRFRLLSAAHMPDIAAPLRTAMEGDTGALAQLAEVCPSVEPDGEPRVWLAAGNCLIGNAWHSTESMVITALSSYNCMQCVGYTVPSWYGKGGWGTLSLLMDNTEGTTLAEAWFLNNQFLLHETQQLAPELLQAEFNDAEMGAPFLRQMEPRLHGLVPKEQLHDALGLVHDRDVVALYGDPAWSATVDNSHSPRPLHVEWQDDMSLSITAMRAHSGRCAIWFPRAKSGATGCNVAGAVVTNDFILFPQLELKAGETLRVHLRSQARGTGEIGCHHANEGLTSGGFSARMP